MGKICPKHHKHRKKTRNRKLQPPLTAALTGNRRKMGAAGSTNPHSVRQQSTGPSNYEVVKAMTIPLANPVFDDEMKAAAVNALQNEKFVMGESVLKFEEEFAAFCGAKHAVSTSSGTAALQFACKPSELQPKTGVDDTVQLIATANAAYCAGATPEFSDINIRTCNLDVSAATKKLARGAKPFCCSPVRVTAEMQSVLDAAQTWGASVVEDCCQAHGANTFGSRVGSLGDVGCFSFYPPRT
jgi:perosamine synthetase